MFGRSKQKCAQCLSEFPKSAELYDFDGRKVCIKCLGELTNARKKMDALVESSIYKTSVGGADVEVTNKRVILTIKKLIRSEVTDIAVAKIDGIQVQKGFLSSSVVISGSGGFTMTVNGFSKVKHAEELRSAIAKAMQR